MQSRSFATYQVLVALVSVLAVSSVARAEVIRDEALAYRLTLPPGFALDLESSVSASTYRGSLAKGGSAMVSIRSLRGSLDDYNIDDSINQMQMRADHVERRSAQWMGEDVTVIVVYQTLEGGSLVELSALLPLQPEAIRLTLVGPAEQEQELQSLLRQLLASLEGESSTDQGGGAWVKGVVGAIVLLAIGIWWQRAKREALDHYFDPSVEEEGEREVADESGHAGSKNYVCKVCGLESESNSFCPDCIADTMIEA